MKKKSAARSAFFNPRIISFAFCLICAVLALILFGLYPGGNALARQKHSSAQDQSSTQDFTPGNLQSLQLPSSAEGAGNQIAPDSSFASDSPLVGTCALTVLANDGWTSGNARAPQTRNAFERSVYLIKATELAAAGFTSGSSPTAIGWNYQTGGTAGSAPLIVYIQNTADTTNTKSTTWATAITGMTIVHNATTSLP